MGFISKDVFMDKRSQMEEKIAQGRYFSMMYQRTDLQQPAELALRRQPEGDVHRDRRADQLEVGAPKLEGLGIEGWLLAMISSKSKHPDRAIRFLSYMISEEGQTDCMLGIQGAHWDFVKGKKSFLPEYMYLERDNKEKHKSIFGDGYWIVNRPDLTDPWFPAPEPPLAQPIEWTLGKIISTAQYNNVDPPADRRPGRHKDEDLDQEFGRLLPKLILASTDAEFDKLFNAFVKFKKDTGEEKLLAYQQQRVDDNKKKLGLK